MTDPDDNARKGFGWTGSDGADFEPDTGPTRAPRRAPEPPPPPIPGRAPVDYQPPTKTSMEDSGTDEPADTQALSFRDGERGPTTFREPVPPPPPPVPPRPEGPVDPQHPWPMPPTQRPPAPPNPPNEPPQNFGPGSPWPAEGFAPRPGVQTVPPAAPSSYADRIRVEDLVPAKRRPPTGGWRLLVYRATFGLVNPGPSPEDIRQEELEAKIKGVLRGHYKVGVMGKGGVGKTTVSASIGSIFAELRQDDRVVAIDADTAFGKLGSRVDPSAHSSYWELATDKHLDTFADVRSRVGNNAAGLFVLAGEASPARRRVLDAAIYREATARLDRHFSISVVDCSSTMDSPVTQEVLRDLDALIVVSSPWVDGAAAAGQTLDWIAARGMTSLLQRTIVVLNDSDGHSDKRTRSILTQQFAGQGQMVVEVPFDGHLRPGGVIATREMSTPVRRKFLEIAAALAANFPSEDDRNRDRQEI